MLYNQLPRGLPSAFWLLFWGRLLNAIGTSLVFPFLTLFLHVRLHESMTMVGLVLTARGIAQAAAVIAGGYLADRWGRRATMLLSLLMGACFTVLMAVVVQPGLLVAVVLLRGLFFPLFVPASLAYIADILPAERLYEGYSFNRVAANTGIILGPMIGAFLVGYSFTLLFVLSGMITFCFAVILWRGIKPISTAARATRAATASLSMLSALIRDRALMGFSGLMVLTQVVYAQLYWVLPLYLVSNLHQPMATFGFFAAENALLVVLLQVPTTRVAERFPAGRAMAAGALLYAAGFGSMALWHSPYPFILSVAIITLGENLINPGATTWIAQRADPERRGRYMSIRGLVTQLGNGSGPLLGGVLLDTGGGLLLWGGSFLLAFFVGLVFPRLDRGQGPHPLGAAGDQPPRAT